MDYPHNLKHLSRSPLNFNRIPAHLCVKIIEKQSPGTIFNLPHATNSRVCHLVEMVVYRNPLIAELREILQKHEKNEIFEARSVQKLFPPSNYVKDDYADFEYYDEFLIGWGNRVHYEIWRYLRQQKLTGLFDEIEARLKFHSRRRTPFITELWKEQQRLAPRKISLSSVPNELLGKIMAKTSSHAAIRLAKTCSAATVAFDEYIHSVPVILTMIETGPLVIGDAPSYEWSQRNVRRTRYHVDSLLKSSLAINLWPDTVDKISGERLVEKCIKGSIEDEKKNYWNKQFLGYSDIRVGEYLIP